MNHHHRVDSSLGVGGGEPTFRFAFVRTDHRYLPKRSFYLESRKDGTCKLIGSWDGIICIGVRRNSPPYRAGVVVVNPVSMAYAVVCNPIPDGGEFIAGYAHPDTFTVHLMYCCYKQGKPIFQIIKVGDLHWREIAAERLAAVTDTLSEIGFDKQGINSIVPHGKLHWQLRTSSAQWVVLVFDMVTEEFRSMAAPQCATTLVRGFAVLTGRLWSLVIPESKSLEMWVLEDYHDHEQQSWQVFRVIDMTATTHVIDIAKYF
uniref:F-box associated beta-propeller type 3 domain-containing protein n=1 Tax=Leersia perrieri TaxID=77586 RepID=A0A0D9XJD2_9ORYZ